MSALKEQHSRSAPRHRRLKAWAVPDIHYLKVFEVGAEAKFSAGKPVELTCPQTVEEMKEGSKFTAIVQKADKSWQMAAHLEIMPIETEYLKIKKAKSTRDNLESLPIF